MTKSRKVTVEDLLEISRALEDKFKDLETAKISVDHYRRKLYILIDKASAQTVKQAVKSSLMTNSK